MVLFAPILQFPVIIRRQAADHLGDLHGMIAAFIDPVFVYQEPPFGFVTPPIVFAVSVEQFDVGVHTQYLVELLRYFISRLVLYLLIEFSEHHAGIIWINRCIVVGYLMDVQIDCLDFDAYAAPPELVP